MWVKTPAWATLFSKFDNVYCAKRHSSSTNGLTVYREKQPVAWKVCSLQNLCEIVGKHISRWTGGRDMTANLLKTALNSCQSINQSEKVKETSVYLWLINILERNVYCENFKMYFIKCIALFQYIKMKDIVVFSCVNISSFC